MTPIELLQKELSLLKGNLDKSYAAYMNDQISENQHETHRENLEPKIEQYEHAIQTLQQFG